MTVPSVERELLILPEHFSSPQVFSGVRVTMCMFCWSLFVLLSFFLWPLCCLSFKLRILITPVVSSNSSYTQKISTNALPDLKSRHETTVSQINTDIFRLSQSQYRHSFTFHDVLDCKKSDTTDAFSGAVIV
jgi:hypothetical protein